MLFLLYNMGVLNVQCELNFVIKKKKKLLSHVKVGMSDIRIWTLTLYILLLIIIAPENLLDKKFLLFKTKEINILNYML
jgi:hypothetical protein